MRKITFSLAAIVAGLLVTASNADEAAFTYKVQPVKGPISMVYGAGGNIAVLKGESSLLIIDNGFDKNAAALKDTLASFAEQTKYVLNTHYHGDHTGANAVLGMTSTIMAHHNVRTRLGAGDKPAAALPDVTYQDGTTLHFAGQTVSAKHYANGHTDGDTIVFFQPANVVHMGDHMFESRFPYVDVDGGGSLAGYTKNVAKVISQIDTETIVIPGHGEVGDINDLKKFHAMLVATTDEVKQLKDSGITLEQAKAKGLNKKWADWSWGFITQGRWIATIWGELK